jgi:hypothetical protein
MMKCRGWTMNKFQLLCAEAGEPPRVRGKNRHMLFFARKTKNHKTAAHETPSKQIKQAASTCSLTRWNSFPRHCSHSLAAGWILFIKIPLYQHKTLKTIIRFKYLNKHTALLCRIRAHREMRKTKAAAAAAEQAAASSVCGVARIICHLLSEGTLESQINPNPCKMFAGNSR